MVQQLSRQGKRMERPLVPSGLVLLAGLLIFVDGLAILIAGTPTGPYADISFPSSLAEIGGLGAFFGFVLFLLGIYLLLEPLNHRAFGIGVIVVSLITLWINFGFLIEVVLALIGGVLAIVFDPGIEVRSRPRAEDQGRPSA